MLSLAKPALHSHAPGMSTEFIFQIWLSLGATQPRYKLSWVGAAAAYAGAAAAYAVTVKIRLTQP